MRSLHECTPSRICNYHMIPHLPNRRYRRNISPDIAAFAGIVDALQDKQDLPRLWSIRQTRLGLVDGPVTAQRYEL